MTSATHAYRLLFDEQGIGADLKVCKDRERNAFNRIVMVLALLRANPSLAEYFITVGTRDDLIDDVAWVESLAVAGINATRVKVAQVQSWRLIFFADHRRRQAALVAVMHRGQGYENDKKLWERLKDAYDRLGFQRLPL